MTLGACGQDSRVGRSPAVRVEGYPKAEGRDTGLTMAEVKG